jgi:hypothetical protein
VVGAIGIRDNKVAIIMEVVEAATTAEILEDQTVNGKIMVAAATAIEEEEVTQEVEADTRVAVEVNRLEEMTVVEEEDTTIVEEDTTTVVVEDTPKRIVKASMATRLQTQK